LGKGINKKINEISQTPSISTAGSVVAALHFMKIYKVHLFTPYIDEII
jgi:maleate cis-trans isomerase